MEDETQTTVSRGTSLLFHDEGSDAFSRRQDVAGEVEHVHVVEQ